MPITFGDGAVTLKGLSQDGGWRIFLKTFAQDVLASSMDGDVHVVLVSLSTASSTDILSVSISTTSRKEVQVVSLSTASSMDVQGVSIFHNQQNGRATRNHFHRQQYRRGGV